MPRRGLPIPLDPALVAALSDVPFPLSKEAAAEWVGGATVALEPGVDVPLADLLRGLPQGQLDDALQASRLVEARWQAIAASLAEVARAEDPRAGGGLSREDP